MPDTAPVLQSLLLEDLTLAVRLGCSADERSAPQQVRVQVELRFVNPLPAGTSDRLEDTVCYARISSAIREHCESREFNLIERLGFEVYHLVRKMTEFTCQTAVRIHKVKPPVPNLRGGVFFSCGEFYR